MTFSTGALGSARIACEAGAGFGVGAAGAAANAPVVVAAAPMIAAVATTDMTLRLEPFKVGGPFEKHDVVAGSGGGAGVAVRSGVAAVVPGLGGPCAATGADGPGQGRPRR
ncbi:hypothetical protein CP979_31535 [Streptomyces filamentosus]|uniref:Uncharacterized protein n=1 Tax=Streptomyces filamentosus TaxID=67294 RepID=A0A919BYH7_STRFL|nr:hypothetical protein CP979_31535 [Streptomyces filamentosus]GHG30011.1 hypothetical protein GCM10017667_79730 [Streptomyces filamentosus]